MGYPFDIASHFLLESKRGMPRLSLNSQPSVAMQTPRKDYFCYLPISEREQQWGLYVTAGGFESVRPGESYPRPGHRHGFTAEAWRKGRILQDYAALYVIRGEGEFQSKPSGVRKLVAGNVFLLFPGVWHYYRPLPSVGWDDYWVVFNGRNVERLVEHNFMSPQNPVLDTGPDDVLLHAYVTLIDRFRAEPVGFEQLLAASVTEILAAMLAAVRVRHTASRAYRLICEAKSLLEAQTNASPAIGDMAVSLGLSPTQLHRIFKKYTGLSPYQYYLQLRLERAKQMLHGTTMNIKQIAALLGFESPFHLSRTFSRKTGMSPSQWRRHGHSAEAEFSQ